MEFYPLSHYQKTMRDQFWLQVGMVFGVCIVLVSAVLIVIHPVIVSVEAVLKAMHRVEEGDFTTRVEKRGNMPAEVVEIADGFNEMVAQTDLLLGQVRQSALEQKNAEISALEAQIDPHFLYNTLDTINWKAIAREEYEISEMVGDLGDILRYAIKNAGGVTTLGEEIAWLKSIPASNRRSWERKSRFSAASPPKPQNAPCISCFCSPLWKTASDTGCMAAKRTAPDNNRRAGKRYAPGEKIEDNGKGMPEETVTILNQPDYHREDHFGIENVRKRLRLYYGEAASVLFESRPSEYTRVTLCIPVMEEKKN